ncbi:hypothetical protein ACFY2N_35210, partial [Streptomyces rubiginosohelvolus]|uniref:hypothetical protein n=1 Tax=Streptomyces rubiginosohelvolus TaxID=67362 RepID=UPI003697E1EC
MPQPTINNTLTDLVERNVDILAVAMRDNILQCAPEYVDLETVHKIDLLDEAHHALRLGIEYSLALQPTPEIELPFFRDVGEQRARASSSLRDLKATYDATYVGWLRKLLEIADETHYAEIRAFLETGSDELARFLRASEVGWAAARARMGGHGQAREVLMKQLLEGGSVTAAAEAAQLVLPPGYMVLLCQPRRAVPESHPASPQVGVHALESIPGALWRGDPSRGNLLVLLPAREDPGMAR